MIGGNLRNGDNNDEDFETADISNFLNTVLVGGIKYVLELFKNNLSEFNGDLDFVTIRGHEEKTSNILLIFLFTSLVALDTSWCRFLSLLFTRI